MTSASGLLRTTAVRMVPAALAVLIGRYAASSDASLATFLLQPFHAALLAYMAVVAALLMMRSRRRDESRNPSSLPDA
jgi:hypothetical protein